MSNHIQHIPRSRPDVVATLDDTQVARRWLMLCPVCKRKDILDEAAGGWNLTLTGLSWRRRQSIYVRTVY